MAYASMTDKEKKAYDKVFDEKNELFSGTINLYVLDGDGYAKKTKGSAVEAVLHLEPAPEGVKLVAHFSSSNPLFYLQVKSDDSLYLFGTLNVGLGKASKLMEIGRFLPKRLSDLDNEIEASQTKTIGTAQMEMGFLKNFQDKLANVEIVVGDKRQTRGKLHRITVGIPTDAWKEIKEYRIRSYLQDKAWEGLKKGGEEDKKEGEEKTEETG